MNSNHNNKILIISTSKKEEHEIGLYNYLQSVGFNTDIIKIDNLVVKLGRDSRIFYRTQDITHKYDVAIPFIQRKYYMLYKIILKVFEDEGIETYINSKYIDYALESNILIKEIDKHNISTLKTYVSISDKPLLNILDTLEFPLLIKITGEGRSIIIKSRESVSSILDTIESIKKCLVIKEIFPDMQYEEYLYIDGYTFGIRKSDREYEETKANSEINKIASKLHEILASKIIMFSIYRDENDRIYFDDIHLPHDIQRFIDIYGNNITLALSKSLIKGKGIREYLKWIMNNLKLNYLFSKKSLSDISP